MLYRGNSAPGVLSQPRHYHNRQRAGATYRALVGAQLRLGLSPKATSLPHAAIMVGSSPQYVAAMQTLVEADAWDLIDAVLDGVVPLLKAADSVRNRAHLLKAWRASDGVDRKALGSVEGVDNVWDDVLAPNLA